MSKPSPLQREVILAIKNELDYWLTTNDIHSPSHGSSIENEMFDNMPDVDMITLGRLAEIEDAVAELWVHVSKLTPCPTRSEMAKNFKP